MGLSRTVVSAEAGLHAKEWFFVIAAQESGKKDSCSKGDAESNSEQTEVDREIVSRAKIAGDDGVVRHEDLPMNEIATAADIAEKTVRAAIFTSAFEVRATANGAKPIAATNSKFTAQSIKTAPANRFGFVHFVLVRRATPWAERRPQGLRAKIENAETRHANAVLPRIEPIPQQTKQARYRMIAKNLAQATKERSRSEC